MTLKTRQWKLFPAGRIARGRSWKSYHRPFGLLGDGYISRRYWRCEDRHSIHRLQSFAGDWCGDVFANHFQSVDIDSS